MQALSARLAACRAKHGARAYELSRSAIRPRLVTLGMVTALSLALVMILGQRDAQRTLFEARVQELRTLVDVAIGLVQARHHESGAAVTESALQAALLDLLSDMTFEGERYFWVMRADGRILSSGLHPELEGQSPGHFSQPVVAKAVSRILAAHAEGESWVEYRWFGAEPGADGIKTTYFTYYAPWGWLIGTGLATEQLLHEVRAQSRNSALVALGCFTVILVLIVAIARQFMLEIHRAGIIDPLTSLHARRVLPELSRQMAAAHDRQADASLVVAFMDIDHFKAINDRFGHQAGDEVIAEVGAVIKEATRRNDLAIRYGGEEFVLMMLCATRDDGVAAIERIRSAVAASRFTAGTAVFNVTLSAGMAARRPGEAIEDVVMRADGRLLAAKRGGRDRLVGDAA
jgi:methyl-accepting chemotaxis protein